MNDGVAVGIGVSVAVDVDVSVGVAVSLGSGDAVGVWVTGAALGVSVAAGTNGAQAARNNAQHTRANNCSLILETKRCPALQLPGGASPFASLEGKLRPAPALAGANFDFLPLCFKANLPRLASCIHVFPHPALIRASFARNPAHRE